MPLESVNEETNNIEESGSNSASEGKGSPTTANTNSFVSVLTIRRPGRDDSRVYVCKASNDYGWAELKIRLNVKGKCMLCLLFLCPTSQAMQGTGQQ